MNLELRHLKVVCAIAETGSVTKAASLLGLAQPALTAQLQRIERTLGGPLFDRDRRGARPTALGELVLSRARVLLPAMKGLQDEAARLAGAGLDTTMTTALGAYLAMFSDTCRTILALTSSRSIRLMPGLRGRPAVTTTTSEPSMAS